MGGRDHSAGTTAAENTLRLPVASFYFMGFEKGNGQKRNLFYAGYTAYIPAKCLNISAVYRIFPGLMPEQGQGCLLKVMQGFYSILKSKSPKYRYCRINPNLEFRMLNLMSPKRLFLGLSLLALAAFPSCYDEPQLSFVPQIEFENVEFVRGDFLDSIIVFINFEDGDGDLGLRGEETAPPYQPYDFVTDDQGNLVTFGSRPDLPPFSPLDWIVFPEIEGVVVEDTVQIVLNPNHNNFFIEFFQRPPGGSSFSEWNPSQAPFYQSFNGRFPILNTRDENRPLAGTIRYAMVSSQWRNIFGNNEIRLRVQIQDRALNRSNTAESEVFTLNQAAE